MERKESNETRTKHSYLGACHIKAKLKPEAHKAPKLSPDTESQDQAY